MDGETSEEVQELGLSTAKRGVIYVGGQIASTVITLILLVFLARILQPSTYGLYAIGIAFNSFLGIASNFGISTAFRKMLPEMGHDDRHAINVLLSNGYTIAFSIALAIAIAGLLLSGYVAVNFYHNPSLALILQIASVGEFLMVVFNLTQGALVGMGLVKEATVANAVYALLNLIGSVVLVLLGYGVIGAMAGLLIGLVVGTVANFSYITRKVGIAFVRPTRAIMKRLTQFSAPVVASYIAQVGAQNFSILLLGVFALSSVVGNFGAAYKLARFVELLITSITFILVGTFSAALAKKETAEKIGSIYNNSVLYSALFLFPLIAYSVSVAVPMTNILFTAQYSSAPFYFSVIVVGMGVGIIGSFAGTLIIGKGDTKRFMKYQIGAVIVQLLLLFVLTPIYQALGVLIAIYMITPIFLDVIYIRALEEQFKFKHVFGQLARVAAISIITGVVLYCVAYAMHQSKWSLLVNGIILLLLFPALAGLTKAVKKTNLEFIKHAGARLKQLKFLVDYIVGYTLMFARE